eukprot:GHUV01042174.1.p1 GENE.GHUV01042174.1~~GHUV01042174.1.p1  ORF type:complete len:110 (-),score=8.48 GHUV01042174.1:245-574(-)
MRGCRRNCSPFTLPKPWFLLLLGQGPFNAADATVWLKPGHFKPGHPMLKIRACFLSFPHLEGGSKFVSIDGTRPISIHEFEALLQLCFLLIIQPWPESLHTMHAPMSLW